MDCIKCEHRRTDGFDNESGKNFDYCGNYGVSIVNKKSITYLDVPEFLEEDDLKFVVNEKKIIIGCNKGGE